jgi:hypothetical protein
MKHMVVNGTMAVLYINSMKEALKAFHKMCLLKIATNTPIIRTAPAMLLWKRLGENNVTGRAID